VHAIPCAQVRMHTNLREAFAVERLLSHHGSDLRTPPATTRDAAAHAHGEEIVFEAVAPPGIHD
jgi:hypothetical protein